MNNIMPSPIRRSDCSTFLPNTVPFGGDADVCLSLCCSVSRVLCLLEVLRSWHYKNRRISGNVSEIIYPPCPLLFFSLSSLFPSPLYFAFLYKLRGVDSCPLTQKLGIRRTGWQLVCCCLTGTGSEKQDRQSAKKGRRFKICFCPGECLRMFRCVFVELELFKRTRKWHS